MRLTISDISTAKVNLLDLFSIIILQAASTKASTSRLTFVREMA